MQRSRSDWIPCEHPAARAQPIWGVVAIEASVRLITSVRHCHAGFSGLDHPEPLRERVHLPRGVPAALGAYESLRLTSEPKALKRHPLAPPTPGVEPPAGSGTASRAKGKPPGSQVAQAPNLENCNAFAVRPQPVPAPESD